MPRSDSEGSDGGSLTSEEEVRRAAMALAEGIRLPETVSTAGTTSPALQRLRRSVNMVSFILQLAHGSEARLRYHSE